MFFCLASFPVPMSFLGSGKLDHYFSIFHSINYSANFGSSAPTPPTSGRASRADAGRGYNKSGGGNSGSSRRLQDMLK